MSDEAGPTRPAAIYEAVRASILDQTEPPGSTLTETAIAERFGVTRPTAKLAIERLVADGLLRREANRAARVPELTRADIRDLYDTRATIEGAAVTAHAHAGTVPAAVIAAHRELVEHASGSGDFARDDIAFHRALVSGAQSPRLARLHSLLMGEVELCIGQVQAHHLLAAADVAAQHQGILDAITASDPERASSLMTDHLTGARDALVAHYTNTHGAE